LEAELIALLNAALRRTDACDSVTVGAIHQVSIRQRGRCA
jgi:hypothetical protein